MSEFSDEELIDEMLLDDTKIKNMPIKSQSVLLINYSLYEKAVAILYWQTNPYFHPLTCANDNCNNASLYYDNGILKCHKCDYEQKNIPDVILEVWKNEHS